MERGEEIEFSDDVLSDDSKQPEKEKESIPQLISPENIFVFEE